MRKWKITLSGENYKEKKEKELLDYLMAAKKRHIDIGDFDRMEIFFFCFQFDATLVKDFLAEYKDNIALLKSNASSIKDNFVKMTKLKYLVLDEIKNKAAPAGTKDNVYAFLANHADTLVQLYLMDQGNYVVSILLKFLLRMY